MKTYACLAADEDEWLPPIQLDDISAARGARGGARVGGSAAAAGSSTHGLDSPAGGSLGLGGLQGMSTGGSSHPSGPGEAAALAGVLMAPSITPHSG